MDGIQTSIWRKKLFQSLHVSHSTQKGEGRRESRKESRSNTRSFEREERRERTLLGHCVSKQLASSITYPTFYFFCVFESLVQAFNLHCAWASVCLFSPIRKRLFVFVCQHPIHFIHLLLLSYSFGCSSFHFVVCLFACPVYDIRTTPRKCR